MDTVKVKFTYTQSEYVKAERQYLIESKLISIKSIAILAAFFVFSVFSLFLSSFDVLSIIALAVAVIAGAIGIVLYFYVPVLKFNQTSKFLEEYTLTFSKDRIHFETINIDSELKWDVYSEYRINNEFFYLIQAPRVYTLIPKRVFANPEEEQVFESLILTQIIQAQQSNGS